MLNKKFKNIKATTVNGWVNIGESQDDITSAIAVVPRDDSDFLDAKLIDFMGIDEFIDLMQTKTKGSYDSLWKVSKILAAQLKSSKSLLALTSNIRVGKSRSEMLNKMLESLKFSLAANQAYILEYSADANCLIVTYADNKAALNQKVSLDTFIEGSCFKSGKLLNTGVKAPLTSCATSSTYNVHYSLCIPFSVDNVVSGVIAIYRGDSLPSNGSVVPSVSFNENDESVFSNIAGNVEFVLRNAPAVDPLTDAPIFSSSNKNTIDDVLQWIVRGACTEVGADRLSVFSYTQDKFVFECTVSSNNDTPAPETPTDAEVCLKIVKSRSKANLSFQDAQMNVQDYSAGEPSSRENVMYFPIYGNTGVCIGVIEAFKGSNESYAPQAVKSIADHSRRIAVLLQSKAEAISNTNEKSLISNLSAVIYQVLSAGTVAEMAFAAKASIGYLIESDFVEMYSVNNNFGHFSSLERIVNDAINSFPNGSGKSAAASLQGSATSLNSPDKPITPVPQEILNCISTGEVFSYTSFGVNEFLPGLKPKIAMVLPIGSKVLSGNPGRYVLVIARTNSDVKFTSYERQVMDMFMELLSCATATFQRVQLYEQNITKKRFELNMIINALQLLQNYVMLLDDVGNVIACTQEVEEVLGKGKLSNTHINEWFDDSQSVLKADVLSVYTSGKYTQKDCVLFKTAANPQGTYISYQLCPVSAMGEVHGDKEPALATQDIGAMIVILHVHNNDEDGVKKLRELLAAKARRGTSDNDSNSVAGTMNAVAHAICEIGGRAELDRNEQMAVNLAASNLLQVSRNLRLSVNGRNPLPVVESPANLVLVPNDSKEIPNLFEWEFDVNTFEKPRLRGILGKLFESMFNLSDLSVNPVTLATYFREVEKHYRNNPFHNFYHITCVTHFSYMLLKSVNAVALLNTPVNNMLYIFSIMLSAVVHDVDHPGNSNLFEINSKSELALLYNEQSVLENHHCSTAFRLMRLSGCDVLAEMPAASYKEVKKSMVSAILATDMSVHFEMIDKVKAKVQSPWNMNDANDISLFCRVFLHAADLSNPVRPFPLSKLWASRISEEFNKQVELEKRLSLPVLGFMITPDEKTLCKNEIGFASFVVAPMWRSLELLFPSFAPLIEQLNTNLDCWKKLLEEITKKEEEDKKNAEGTATA